MKPTVEPLDGPELDRLITALLNVIGTVQQIVELEMDEPGPGGVAIIGRSAARLGTVLSVFAEHHDDEELVVVTEFLAIASILIAQDAGVEDAFFPDRPGGDV